MLRDVTFIEYMHITGDLVKRKLAESFYDKNTGNVEWKKNKDSIQILAHRSKGQDGNFINRVDETIYEEWLRSRG